MGACHSLAGRLSPTSLTPASGSGLRLFHPYPSSSWNKRPPGCPASPPFLVSLQVLPCAHPLPWPLLCLSAPPLLPVLSHRPLGPTEAWPSCCFQTTEEEPVKTGLGRGGQGPPTPALAGTSLLSALHPGVCGLCCPGEPPGGAQRPSGTLSTLTPPVLSPSPLILGLPV